jgi:hypothetical protein
MVALNTPSLPSATALLGSLKAISGIAVDLGSVQTKGNAFVFGLFHDAASECFP